MKAIPVTIKLTKKQLELIDAEMLRVGIKTRSALIKNLLFIALHANLETWHENELTWGGDRKSEQFEAD